MLDKTFSPADIEARLYEEWESRGFFKAGRKPKAKPSIDKTRRVLRLALCWAVEQGWLEKAPLPETK